MKSVPLIQASYQNSWRYLKIRGYNLKYNWLKVGFLPFITSWTHTADAPITETEIWETLSWTAKYKQQTGIKSHILQTSNKCKHFEEKESSENDLSTSYSFNIKMFSPVISFIVQMKMSGGTKILRMISCVSTSSLWGDKYTKPHCRIHTSTPTIAQLVLPRYRQRSAPSEADLPLMSQQLHCKRI